MRSCILSDGPQVLTSEPCVPWNHGMDPPPPPYFLHHLTRVMIFYFGPVMDTLAVAWMANLLKHSFSSSSCSLYFSFPHSRITFSLSTSWLILRYQEARIYWVNSTEWMLHPKEALGYSAPSQRKHPLPRISWGLFIHILFHHEREIKCVYVVAYHRNKYQVPWV